VHDTIPAPGAVVWIRERRWRVERSRREGGVLRLDVIGQAGPATFLAPFDRPASAGGRARPVARRRQHVRAALGQLAARAFGARTIASGVRARLALLPYQLEPALAVTNGARRTLLADDVGLGKTIQAGLILAEIRRRHPAARALVVVPAGLREQWTDELARRFDIRCTEADRVHLERTAREGAHGDSPWLRAGVWIASLDYLKQPHVLDALPAAPWDLVVIDEAHTATGDSIRHAAAARLGRCARRLVLLSATPHSGDEGRFASLMTLGSTGHSADTLTVFRRTRRDIGADRRRRVSWLHVTLSTAEIRFLDTLRAYERATLEAAGPARHDAALVLLSVFRKRALSTAAAAAATLRARLAWLELQDRPPEPDYRQPSLGFTDGQDLSDDDRAGLLADTGLGARHERAWLGRLLTLARSAGRHESKISTLITLLTRAGEPAIVFTEFRTSLAQLALRVPPSWRLATLHGGLRDGERRDVLARFRSGESTVLAATDVAGQGLNLHETARWVVSLELPWNPARLEQRFGRVDRLGQVRPVHLSLLVARHECEASLLAHLARRTLAARRALGNDTLTSAAPGDASLAASLIGEGRTSDVPDRTAPIAFCSAWRRPARVQARALERQRRLAGAWPAHVAPPPLIRGAWPALRTGPAGSVSGLLIFDGSLLDEQGVVVETRPVAVRVAGLRTRPDVSPQVIALAEEAVRRRLAPRLRRLRRIRQELAAREAVNVDALEQASALDLPRVEVQPGLFDRRALAQVEREARRREDAHRRISRHRDSFLHDVIIGRPVLRVVLLPDP
jgi:superfamily II DNA or RNA helicase